MIGLLVALVHRLLRAHRTEVTRKLGALEPGSWAALARTPVQTGRSSGTSWPGWARRAALEAPPPSEAQPPPHPPAPPSRQGASAGRDADGGPGRAGRAGALTVAASPAGVRAAASGCCSGRGLVAVLVLALVLSLLLTRPPRARVRHPDAGPLHLRGHAHAAGHEPAEQHRQYRAYVASVLTNSAALAGALASLRGCRADRTGATTASARRARRSTASSAT